MAEAEKKSIRAQNTILEAAEEIFAMKGFNGARTAEIAAKAGVNKALLHYYFTNKEKLYQAVMDRILFDTIEIAQDVLRKGLKGKKLIEGLFDAFFDYASRHHHFARLATVDNAGSQAGYMANTLKNFFKPLFQRSVDFLKTEAREGKCRKVDGAQFLITLYLSIIAYFSDAKFISMLLGEEATSKANLEKRKDALWQSVELILDI